MPMLLAAIPAVLAAVGTGVGLSETLGSSPGTTKPATLAQTTPGAMATKTAQEASISQQFPNLQATTGGSLSPDAWVQLSQLLSGQAGTPGVSGTNTDLINKIVTGNTNTTPGGGGLTNTTFG